MPSRLPRGCEYPGCGGLAPRGLFCSKHQRRRNNFDDPFYRTPYWRGVRVRHLLIEPFCRLCMAEGQQVEAIAVDHIVSRKHGGTEEDSNLQSLCQRHHSLKTFAGA